MRTRSVEFDLHVVLLLSLTLLACAGIMVRWHAVWPLVLPLLVPQGRILTRTLVDYPSFRRSGLGYFLLHELVVFLTVGGALAIRCFAS